MSGFTMDGYFCSECGLEVIVRKGEIIRACKHTGPVIAGMKAVARSHGSLEQAAQKEG